MKRTESECRDCDLPCVRSSCKYYEVTRYYCDDCTAEGMLYEFDGLELCIDCVEKRLCVVEGSDIY